TWRPVPVSPRLGSSHRNPPAPAPAPRFRTYTTFEKLAKGETFGAFDEAGVDKAVVGGAGGEFVVAIAVGGTLWVPAKLSLSFGFIFPAMRDWEADAASEERRCSKSTLARGDRRGRKYAPLNRSSEISPLLGSGKPQRPTGAPGTPASRNGDLSRLPAKPCYCQGIMDEWRMSNSWSGSIFFLLSVVRQAASLFAIIVGSQLLSSNDISTRARLKMRDVQKRCSQPRVIAAPSGVNRMRDGGTGEGGVEVSITGKDNENAPTTNHIHHLCRDSTKLEHAPSVPVLGNQIVGNFPIRPHPTGAACATLCVEEADMDRTVSVCSRNQLHQPSRTGGSFRRGGLEYDAFALSLGTGRMRCFEMLDREQHSHSLRKADAQSAAGYPVRCRHQVGRDCSKVRHRLGRHCKSDQNSGGKWSRAASPLQVNGLLCDLEKWGDLSGKGTSPKQGCRQPFHNCQVVRKFHEDGLRKVQAHSELRTPFFEHSRLSAIATCPCHKSSNVPTKWLTPHQDTTLNEFDGFGMSFARNIGSSVESWHSQSPYVGMGVRRRFLGEEILSPWYRLPVSQQRSVGRTVTAPGAVIAWDNPSLFLPSTSKVSILGTPEGGEREGACVEYGWMGDIGSRETGTRRSRCSRQQALENEDSKYVRQPTEPLSHPILSVGGPLPKGRVARGGLNLTALQRTPGVVSDHQALNWDRTLPQRVIKKWRTWRALGSNDKYSIFGPCWDCSRRFDAFPRLCTIASPASVASFRKVLCGQLLLRELLQEGAFACHFYVRLDPYIGLFKPSPKLSF
ncbi:hypothetical protein BDK51DRAFT_30509, partial [Blyttiomyces helicus]